jgi:hypothetical protein
MLEMCNILFWISSCLIIKFDYNGLFTITKLLVSLCEN